MQAAPFSKQLPVKQPTLSQMDQLATEKMKQFARQVLGLTDQEINQLTPQQLATLVKNNGFDAGLLAVPAGHDDVAVETRQVDRAIRREGEGRVDARGALAAARAPPPLPR